MPDPRGRRARVGAVVARPRGRRARVGARPRRQHRRRHRRIRRLRLRALRVVRAARAVGMDAGRAHRPSGVWRLRRGASEARRAAQQRLVRVHRRRRAQMHRRRPRAAAVRGRRHVPRRCDCARHREQSDAQHHIVPRQR
eukprot:4710481-Pleurochrysis_carterae.AAC.2